MDGFPCKKDPEQHKVNLVQLSSTNWESNRHIRPEPSVANSRARRSSAPQPEQPVVKESIPKGQIVDVADGNDEKSPDAKYLADHDNKVAKETRAKETTPMYGKAMAKGAKAMQLQEVAKREASKASTAKVGNGGTESDTRAPTEAKTMGHMETPHSESKERVAMLEQGRNGDVRSQVESGTQNGNSNRYQMAPAPSDSHGEDSAYQGLARCPGPGQPDSVAREHGAGAGRRGAGSPRRRRAGRWHLPQHPRVQVRVVLQSGEAARGRALEPPRSACVESTWGCSMTRSPW